MLESYVQEGARIGGYRLLRQIGEGGMGVVWMAKHNMLGRRAAIKILRPEYSVQHTIVTRFFNEARTATAISDPGIIQIFDFGYHTDGSAFIVMELLDGEPLDRRLRRTGVLPVRTALRLCRQVASAIGAAHARGVIHRDLKPENIFVVRDPEVAGGERAKVLDFGIAKLAGDIGAYNKTNASAIIGTPTYMSPEQCRGAGEVDQRSDIYSLGCVLFVLMTGHPPFATKATGVLIMQHMTDPAPRPSSRAPGIPPEVDDLILRCLAKDPANRFASGTELALAIDEIAALPSIVNATVNATPPPSDGVPMLDAVPTPGAAGTFATMPMPEPSPARTTLASSATFVTSPSRPATRRGRGKLYAWIAAAVVAAGAVVAVVASQGSPAPSQAASALVPGDQGSVAAAAAKHAPPPSPPPADPRPARAKAELRALLEAFSAWSADHAGAPCPTSAKLGGRSDPWGNAYAVTCTDQPADQIIGARSPGPDGVTDTDDDLVSWAMGREVTRLVRGQRWVSSPAATQPPLDPARPQPSPQQPTTASRPQPSPLQPKKPTKPGGPKQPHGDGIIDVDGDGIPDSR